MEQKSGSPGGGPLMKNGMKIYSAMKICLPVMRRQQQIPGDPDMIRYIDRQGQLQTKMV